jgi:hypothetical protein
MCDESVLAGTGPRYKKRSRRGFNPGPLLVLFVNILRFASSMYMYLEVHTTGKA